MAEEAKKEIEYTEIEQKAMEEGWIPPDRFKDSGKEVEFKSAEEYIEKGSFFKKIDKQKKEIQELRSTVAGITEHQNKVAKMELDKQKNEYESRINTLEEQKILALDEGDHREATKIDREIRNTQEPEAPKADSSDWDGWIKDNQWYNDDGFLKRAATMAGEQISRDEGLLGRPLFDEVTKYLKEAYPHKFSNQNRQNAANVEGGSNSPSNSSKIASDKDLTPDEKTVYRKFDRMGTFKDDKARKEYFAQVVSLRD